MGTRNKVPAASILVIAVLSGGCMTDRSAAALDAKFGAGWRPSKADCAFGGATPTLDAYCGRVNFGSEGVLALLRKENEQVLARLPSLDCGEHVALARETLSKYADEFTMTELYSCDHDAPTRHGKKVCHVSLLVRDSVSGANFVVDNGAVLNPAVTGGVSKYGEFRREVDVAWTGTAPPEVLIAGW